MSFSFSTRSAQALRSAAQAGALAIVFAAAPAAAQVTVPFTSAATASAKGFVNGNFSARAQIAGDFLQQSFSGVGLPSAISAFTLFLSFQDIADNATPYSFNVFLDAVNVGTVSFVTAGGDPSFLPSTYRLQTTSTFNVGNVAMGAGYVVRVEQTSAGIPLNGGGGNILFDLDGTNGSTVTFAPTAAPEPSTLALLGTGLFTLGAVGARRKRRTNA